jgi:hypothetical protein
LLVRGEQIIEREEKKGEGCEAVTLF